MFESSYSLMLQRAKERFKKEKEVKKETLNVDDDNKLKALLLPAVQAAINSYKKEKGSISREREKDIEVIKLIFAHFDKVEDCRKKLQLYFSGKSVKDLFKGEELSQIVSDKISELENHHFTTGFMDGSKLEDYVVATVDSFYEHIIQPLIYESKVKTDIKSIKISLLECLKNAKTQALLSGRSKDEVDDELSSIVSLINTIDSETTLNCFLNGAQSVKPPKNSLDFFFKKNIQPILAKNIRFNDGYYSEKPIKYEFKDFLDFHLEKYRQERGQKEDKIFIHDKNIIDTLMNYPNLSDDLHEINDKPMSPLLKKHLINARTEFQRYKEQFELEREVKTKTWEPENPSHPQKIIIALHGWRDSVECWNNLGEEAIKKGYKVMAYDHRGYGFDDERVNIGHNNDHLSIDFRKFVQSVMKENPGAEINLVGHSMGGAILLNNQDFIASQKNADGKPAIKSVTCFSPAVTPSLPDFFSEFKNALFGREGHEEALARQQNNQPRFVKAGLSHPANLLKMLTTLPSLLAMMTQAYQSLVALVNPKPVPPDQSVQPDQPAQDSANWTIFYGKKDKAVPFSSFEELKDDNNKNKKVSFKEYSRGDHLLTQGRHATVALDEFFDAIEKPNTEPNKDDLNEVKHSDLVINI